MEKLRQLPNYQNLTSALIPYSLEYTTENKPPYLVLGDAIVPPNATNSISMLVDLPPQITPAYFVFYFKEPDLGIAEFNIRIFHIYIDGHEMATVDVPHDYDTCKVVSLYPVYVKGPVNVTLSPIEGSTDPPILNAMEVFTMSMDLSSSGSSSYYHVMVFALLQAICICFLFG